MIEAFVEGNSAGQFDYKDTPRNRLRVVWELATSRIAPHKYDPHGNGRVDGFFVDFDTPDAEQWEVSLSEAVAVTNGGSVEVDKFGIFIRRTDGWK